MHSPPRSLLPASNAGSCITSNAELFTPDAVTRRTPWAWPDVNGQRRDRARGASRMLLPLPLPVPRGARCAATGWWLRQVSGHVSRLRRGTFQGRTQEEHAAIEGGGPSSQSVPRSTYCYVSGTFRSARNEWPADYPRALQTLRSKHRGAEWIPGARQRSGCGVRM